MDAPPIRDGWVEVDRGRIVAVGRAEPANGERRAASPRVASEPRTAILPGLVNAHTHLELSWMRGRVPPGDAMPAWAARLIRERQIGQLASRSAAAGRRRLQRRGRGRGRDRRGARERDDARRRRDQHARRLRSRWRRADCRRRSSSSSWASARPVPMLWWPAPAKRLAALPAARSPASRNRAARAVLCLARSLSRDRRGCRHGRPLSVHLGESPEEVRFLRDGTGPWRDLLEQIGAWSPRLGSARLRPGRLRAASRTAERSASSPSTASSSKTPSSRRLAACGATVVAVRAATAGPAPAFRRSAGSTHPASASRSAPTAWRASRISTCSARWPQLRRLAPDVPARQILRSATVDGATALGFGGELGLDFARKARRAHRRPRPGRCRGCGRIPCGGNPADGHFVAGSGLSVELDVLKPTTSNLNAPRTPNHEPTAEPTRLSSVSATASLRCRLR